MVTTAIEHESVLAPVKHLSENGFQTTLLPSTAEGIVTPEAAEAAVDEKTVGRSSLYKVRCTGRN